MRFRAFSSLSRAAILAAILLAGGAVEPASALPITESFSFSVPLLGTPPVNPVTGQFTFTFDPNGPGVSTDPFGNAVLFGALDSFTSNFTVGVAATATWNFFYDVGTTELTVGDDCGVSRGCSSFSSTPGTAFFEVDLSPAKVLEAFYAADNTIYSNFGGGTIAPVTAAVPEPATLALFGSALALLGLGLVQRRRARL